MGHPPAAVWLPTDEYPSLADAVSRIAAAHGGTPAELASLLRSRDGPPAGQLAALAWVLDGDRRQVLLVHHQVLGWSCPGGHVEAGELPAATAARELGEETGLALAPESPDPVTLSRDEMPADDRGPAHVHWSLGYLFVANRATPLTTEPGRPAGWFPITALPADAVGDLAPLLAALVAAPVPVSGRSTSSPRPRPSRPAAGGRRPRP